MPIDEQKINLNLQNNLEHKPINASDLPGVNRIGPPENIMLPTYSIYHFNNPHTTAEWYQNDDQFVKYHIMGHAPIDAQGPGAESLNEATKNYQHFGKKFMRRGLSDRQIARLDNKHDIDQSIFDLAQEDLEIQYNYDKQRYENGEISEQKWRQLKNRYNRWSKNLGNNQLSLDQKQNPFDYIQVHKPGDIAPALFSIGLPLAVTAAIYGAPYIPWIMKNVAIPIIGGEIVNDVTRKVSDGYYSSFGDFVYRSTPLDDWTKDTWAETPTKFVTDMSNPGYWAPYGKIVNGFKNIVPAITKTYNKPVKINSTPRGALRYRANPNGKSAIEIANNPTVGNFKAKEFAKNHYGINLSDEQINNIMLQNIDNISYYADDLIEVSPNIQSKFFKNGRFKTPDGSGAEHMVYFDKDLVYKISEPASENVLRKSIAQQLSHNTLGRYGAPLKLEGILRDGTKVRAVYSQPKVELSKWRHFGDIGDLILRKKLQKIGYKKANLGGTSGQAMITPSGHIVDDLRGRNMGYLNGNLVLFDPYHVIHTSNIPTSATSINESIVNSGKSMFRDAPAHQVQWYHPNPFFKHGGKLWNNS